MYKSYKIMKALQFHKQTVSHKVFFSHSTHFSTENSLKQTSLGDCRLKNISQQNIRLNIKRIVLKIRNYNNWAFNRSTDENLMQKSEKLDEKSLKSFLHKPECLVVVVKCVLILKEIQYYEFCELNKSLKSN